MSAHLRRAWRTAVLTKSAGPRMWHGSPSGDLRGGPYGLHVGTKEAARQALEARIGKRADGRDWDGTQEYGQTLLASARGGTGYSSNGPEGVHLPSGKATYGDGTPVSMSARPSLFEVEIICEMTNTPQTPHEDFKANGYMRAAITRGNAKRGYYYINVAEDDGSISAVVPGVQSVRRV